MHMCKRPSERNAPIHPVQRSRQRRNQHVEGPEEYDYHSGGNSYRPENILAELNFTFELATGIACGINSVTQFNFDPWQFLFSYS